jgi:hypothetical protein
MNDRPELLTRAEVAAALRMKPQSIAAAETRGRPLLPKVRATGRALYRASDLAALIDRSVVGKVKAKRTA